MDSIASVFILVVLVTWGVIALLNRIAVEEERRHHDSERAWQEAGYSIWLSVCRRARTRTAMNVRNVHSAVRVHASA